MLKFDKWEVNTVVGKVGVEVVARVKIRGKEVELTGHYHDKSGIDAEIVEQMTNTLNEQAENKLTELYELTH